MPATGWAARSRALDGSWEAVLAIGAVNRLKPYRGDVVLFKADINVGQHPDVHDGWQQLIEGTLRIVPVTGSHMGILREPHVRELANKLEACMEE